MINVKYKIYYHFDGPSKAAVNREELTQDEIQYHLERFPEELEMILHSSGATSEINVEERHFEKRFIVVNVQSSADAETFNTCLKNAVGGLDLYGKEIVRTAQ